LNARLAKAMLSGNIPRLTRFVANRKYMNHRTIEVTSAPLSPDPNLGPIAAKSQITRKNKRNSWTTFQA
jgi:hypothetical protein